MEAHRFDFELTAEDAASIDALDKGEAGRIVSFDSNLCVKFRLPFLSESSRKLFGREPLETQLLNPMALFLNLLAHFSRTWACFS
jgi:hypothetical protein